MKHDSLAPVLTTDQLVFFLFLFFFSYLPVPLLWSSGSDREQQGAEAKEDPPIP